MGWFSNNTVTIDCKKNYDNDKRLTLVDNKHGEAHDFSVSTDILKYLLNEGFGGVENYINELVEERFKKEQENRKWKTYNFFVKKSEVPYVINRIDSSEHLRIWKIHESEMFKEKEILEIEYEADKQILVQGPDGIVIDL